jgi:hypothetical protein
MLPDLPDTDKEGYSMTTNEPEKMFVRIIELPTLRMARSGGGDLEAFDRWWTGVAAQDRKSLFPRDFMWFNPQLEALEWLYALPEGVEDSGGYEVFDFPGGLYAVAASEDLEPKINRTNQLIHEWIAQSDTFDEATQENDPNYPRYDMGHIVTPKNAMETIGYHQMDQFVPIVYKRSLN